MRVPVFAVLLLVASGALAEDLTIESKIDAVTVFPRGAEVQRIAKVEIPEGTHTVVLSDLPEGTDLNSIRVEGRASGSLEIGAVDARRTDILRRDSEQSKSARRRLEDAIEEQNDKLAELNAKIESRQIQKRYVENLAGLPTAGNVVPPGQAGRPQQDWVQLLALIGTSLGEIQDAILQLRVDVRDTTRKIEDLKKELAALAPQQVRRTEVKVNVVAASELEADLIVKYQVRNARWTAFYDARLETGSRNVPSKLNLTRRASIAQQTGEEWKDVVVSLSTARPSGRSAAPELYSMTVDFQPERPPAPAPRVEAQSSAPRAVAKLRSRRIARPARGALVQEKAADIQTSGFQATFKVPDRITVVGTGDAKRVKIETMNIEPSLVVRSVPKFNTTAYLYAKMKLPKGIAPVLRGRVILFRDGTFVGRGRMPELASGEIHELGFGSDDAVRIKYNNIGETRGETGIISSSRTDQRKFKISIKNFHERPITYSILDRRPESLNEEIKVELVGATKPTQSNVKDRRGVLAWEGKLGPEEEKIIDFGYVVSWPADKKVQYRR